MIDIKVMFGNSDYNFCTAFNGDVDAARDYYEGQTFNLGLAGHDDLQTVKAIKFYVEIVSGPFKGERGFCTMRTSHMSLVYVEASDSYKLATTLSQVKVLER